MKIVFDTLEQIYVALMELREGALKEALVTNEYSISVNNFYDTNSFLIKKAISDSATEIIKLKENRIYALYIDFVFHIKFQLTFIRSTNLIELDDELQKISLEILNMYKRILSNASV